MAKFFDSEKRNRRRTGILSVALALSLGLGVFAACTKPAEEEPEEEPTTTTADTQLLKNGNFEFYGERDKEFGEKRALIASPDNWSFSTGSPSSDSASGIIETDEWDKYARSSGTSLVRAEDRVDDEGNEVKHAALTEEVAKAAADKWDSVTIYDRLEFYDFYNVDSADEFELYPDYKYSIDFDDVRYLGEVTDLEPHEGAKEGENGLLMIHNHRTSDGVRGTAQYYTSGTTVTLNAGTSAKLSVWVRTSNLYHYAAGANPDEDLEVTARAGAYIGVTHTVGGTTLDQMQIKNIVTKNEWEQYTIYIRANTFASTTFRLVLGLGQGTSDNRLEAVDGYAFFDDATYEVITNEEYETATATGVQGACTLNSKAKDKKFERDTVTADATKTYALDLYAPFDKYALSDDDVTFGPTEEISGSRTYTSGDIDKNLADNTNSTTLAEARKSVTGKFTLAELKTKAQTNDYLKKIFADDFENKYPFEDDSEIILLLSTNGAAYTAKLPELTLAPKQRKLFSFFVKTSSIRSGASGAGAILVDGENKSTISPFDSTTVATVDIDSEKEELTDIYKGWVQCFFYVQNDTDEIKYYHIELTYGATAIASSTRDSYCDGYAAFANFKTYGSPDFDKTQYGYASTGTYAQKVSLVASVKDSTKFDDPAANGVQIEDGLATPVSYSGVLAGSNWLVEGEVANPNAEELAEDHDLYAGLLAYDYAENYLGLAEPWLKTLGGDGVTLPEGDTDEAKAARKAAAADWWKQVFGNGATDANSAYQPLVIVNAPAEGATAKQSSAYGFFASSSTVSANSASRITVRVKLSKGASAFIYLTDVSDVEKGFNDRLAPTTSGYTYWYDDEGNIVAKDPSSDDFNKKTDVLFTLEDNGLYKNAVDKSDDKYYANLSAFERDDDHNYVTTSGTIAFYHDPDDADENTAYAYYEKETDKYSVSVTPLPTDKGVRYAPLAAPKDYEAVIRVDGNEANEGLWTTVSFYVQTGNAEKKYRLELWAGSRDNETKIPANGYVFFDRCKTESVSNFDELLGETADAMLAYEGTGNYPFRAVDSEGRKIEDRLSGDYALYYTFTFFDSPDYLRYDKTHDTENLGNPWGSYVQSEKEEGMTWLSCKDEDGSLFGGYPTYSMFLSYAENEVTVEADDLTPDEDTSDDTTDDTAAPDGSSWLLLFSSIALAAVLILVIVIMLVRKLYDKYHKKTVKVKTKKKASKKTALKDVKAEEEETSSEEEAPAPAPKKPKDENDPYSE